MAVLEEAQRQAPLRHRGLGVIRGLGQGQIEDLRQGQGHVLLRDQAKTHQHGQDGIPAVLRQAPGAAVLGVGQLAAGLQGRYDLGRDRVLGLGRVRRRGLGPRVVSASLVSPSASASAPCADQAEGDCTSLPSSGSASPRSTSPRVGSAVSREISSRAAAPSPVTGSRSGMGVIPGRLSLAPLRHQALQQVTQLGLVTPQDRLLQGIEIGAQPVSGSPAGRSAPPGSWGGPSPPVPR